ncbi:T9SS type A sorting domain-containing protein, partial [Gilvibacter sp.]|uniref:T9SS type A sorting domain-containing protein n=1 Tax=Gilvibacter sp. TaxID=2729997 RepID=UPI0025C3F4ED
VDYTVIFNEDAVKVSGDDCGLTLTGTATGTIDNVSGSATTYTVSISGISGEGSLRLDLLSGTDIEDTDGNTPPDPFTEGEVHLVSSCFVETFESLAVDANTWTRAGVPFTTSSTNFSVDEFIGAGAGASDRYLDNVDDQGVDKTYSISVTNTALLYMESFEVFVSSEADGANPTNDGSLTVRGLLDGVEVYSFTKTGSFPTTFGSTSGFSTVDFATDGASDFSGEDVDEVEVTISGSFIYVAVDNFKFCEDIVAPIAVCQDVTAELGAEGTVLVAPTDADAGSTDNAARFYLGFETTGFDSETTAGSTPADYGGGTFLINEFAFTVSVTGDYTPVATGTSASDGNVLTFFNAKPDLGTNLFASPNYLGFVNYNNAGVLTASTGGATFSFEAGQTYFMHVLIPDPGAFGMSSVSWDMSIIADAPLEYTCSDVGTITETLYAFDDAGNIDSCSTDITVSARITDWDGGAWTNGVPDLGAVAAFSGDYDTVTGSIESCSCIIGLGTVTVNAGDYLLATEDITVGINGNLVVEHEGSVVQTSETAVTTNNGTISVRKTTPSLSLRDFSILGSPMSMQADAALYDPMRVRMFSHNTLNFVPNADVAAAFPSAENFADDNGDNWSPFTGTLNVAEGYMFRRRGTDPGASGVFDIEFNTGTLNSGPLDISAVFNTDQNSSPNIISNPYASAINADAFIAANSTIISTLYFWEHLTAPSAAYPGYDDLNYDMGDISMYTTGSGGVAAANGGAAPTGFISSAQGFGYKAAAAGTVSFANSMRVTGPNDTFRMTEPVQRDRIWLNLTNETYELRSQALIAFVDDATEAMEPHFDAKRLATPVSIYSQLITGEELAINGLPVWNVEAEVSLGMSSMIEADAVFTISIADMEFNTMPEDTQVYLIDHELNTQTNLTEGDYVFRALNGTYDNRFSLVFEERVLGVDDESLELVGLYPNPAQDNVTLNAPNGVILENVVIYDIRGRQVAQHELSGDQSSFSVAELEAAIYVLNITTDSGVFSLRLIKE